jgi:hypothetical protein
MSALKHLLIFKITGKNNFLADVGILKLFTDGKPVMTSHGFSGGPKSPAASEPIPTGHYRIRTQIRQVVAAYSEANGDRETGMHHWYGIEKIDTYSWQYEWGHFRAALNEPHKNMPQAYRGNFLHGKLREGDYTHGCICERSETILRHLWSMQPGTVDVHVER